MKLNKKSRVEPTIANKISGILNINEAPENTEITVKNLMKIHNFKTDIELKRLYKVSFMCDLLEKLGRESENTRKSSYKTPWQMDFKFYNDIMEAGHWYFCYKFRSDFRDGSVWIGYRDEFASKGGPYYFREWDEGKLVKEKYFKTLKELEDYTKLNLGKLIPWIDEFLTRNI